MNSPPLLVSFTTAEQLLQALPVQAREEFTDQIQSLLERRLPPVVSVRCLATLFGFSPKFVGAMQKGTERYYRTFSIRQGKKKRVIHAPRVALKVIQKWFGHPLAEAVKPADCVFGFVRGQSTIKAVAVHCGSNWVYSIDIENFFPSTPMTRIVETLVNLGYPRHGAELAGKLCCYNGGLSQGSPASPALSNLVFRESDTELVTLAREYRLHYSRYADDIVFSGQDDFTEDLRQRAKGIIESGGWRVSPEKEWLSKRPNRLKVHGLLVHGEHPRLTKGYRNKLRAFKHLLDANRIADKDDARIRGHLSYAKSVEAAARLDEN